MNKESGFMLNEEICKLREKLNNSIISGQDYSVTYELSVQLDKLIAKYYQIELNRTKTPKKKKKGSRLISLRKDDIIEVSKT